MLCLCVSLVVSGSIIVANNTERIYSGSEKSRVGVTFEQRLSLTVNGRQFTPQIPDSVLNILAVAPSPISPIYWAVSVFDETSNTDL